jgi:phosphate transport system substrate-binding protein
MFRKSLIATATVIAITGAAHAQDQIRIVGSSTVYPFSTTVAEQFGKSTPFKTPIVESTGSGGGLKLFCAGVEKKHPHITNASRRIKKSEVNRCYKNGVTDIIEVKVGYDGIVIANAITAPQFKLSLREIFLSLAKNVPGPDGVIQPNPNRTWRDVNPALPATKIEIMGPPPTSGTRDAFVELAMEGGCKTFKSIKDLKKINKKDYKSLCHTIREDGAYVEAGENDNLIVQKLVANPTALGIFGYSFLEQNTDKVQGSVINGHLPTFDNISDGKYSVSRPLFFYVKKANIGVVAGLQAFMAEFTSEAAWGPEGYLSDKGLIPMSDGERTEWRKKVKTLANFGI